jgi:general secretion pathway protein G
MSSTKLILLIIGAILALVVGTYAYRGYRVISEYDHGRYEAGVLSVKSLQMKVQAYQLEVGSLPTSLNDLVERPGGATSWNGPYARADNLTDPFGHPFQFRMPGEHGEFDIVFLGKDGQAGGSGIDADFGSWQISR